MSFPDAQSRETLCSVIAKRLFIPNVGTEHFNRLVAAVFLHFEQSGAGAARLGKETSAQGVPGKSAGS